MGAALAAAAAGGLAAAEGGGESAALGRTAPPAGNPGAGLGPPTAPAGLGPCRPLYSATNTNPAGFAICFCNVDNVKQAMGRLHDAYQHLHLLEKAEEGSADSWS